MKKKIALFAACLFLMSSVAFAAPLTDYKAGKASIDLNYRSTKNSFELAGRSGSFGSRFNLEPSVTYSIADKWALQYRNVSSKSKNTLDWAGMGRGLTGTLTANEFNVLYSLTPEISAFAGYVSAKGTVEADFPGNPKLSDTKDTGQLGLLATVPLADKFAAYGVVGVGDKWLNYEIGISYAFAKDWEFNVDYRSIKVKDLKFAPDAGKSDLKVKGFGFGVTYKFL